MPPGNAAQIEPLLTQALEHAQAIFEADPASRAFSQCIDELGSAVEAVTAAGALGRRTITSQDLDVIYQLAAVLWVQLSVACCQGVCCVRLLLQYLLHQVYTYTEGPTCCYQSALSGC